MSQNNPGTRPKQTPKPFVKPADQIDTIKDTRIEDAMVVPDPKANNLKELAKHMDMPVDPREHVESIEEQEAKVNHRSGMSYSDLKVAYEEEKARAEAFGEQLNKVRVIINNPFHRYGQFVDSVPLGQALEMRKVWQPRENR